MRFDQLAPALAILIPALVIACGDNNAGPDALSVDARPAPDAGGPTSYRANRLGFVSLIEGGPFSLHADVRNRTDLPSAQHIASEGECDVYVHPRRDAQCSPACTDGLCVATNTCEAWPTFASAGTITVTGLKTPLRFEPNQGWYTSTPTLPPDDLFDQGDAITASAPGDVGPGFSLQATGVATLTAQLPITIELHDDVDKEITWTAASDGRIQLALLVGHHLAPYEAILLCETDDDGSLTIPGALITQLPRPSSGLEQHGSWLRRFTREVVDMSDGPIELLVASQYSITQIYHP